MLYVVLNYRALELNLHITQPAVTNLPIDEPERRDITNAEKAGVLDLTSTAKITFENTTNNKLEEKVSFSSILDSDAGRPLSSAFLNLETDASLGIACNYNGKHNGGSHIPVDKALFRVATREAYIPPRAQPGTLLVAHPLLNESFLCRAGEYVSIAQCAVFR